MLVAYSCHLNLCSLLSQIMELTVRYCILLVCLVTLIQAQQQCPGSSSISPCTCALSNGQADITCSGLKSLKALTDIFKVSFPSNELHALHLTDSTLGVFPNDVFQSKSFEIIEITDNRAASFPTAGIFTASKARLTSLTIYQSTEEWQFNFNAVAKFDQLQSLSVAGYTLEFLNSVTDLLALQTLQLQSFTVTTVPHFSNLPALQVLNLDSNNLDSIPAEAFTGLPSLQNLLLGHNKLTNLNTSSLAVDTVLQNIDLTGNTLAVLADNSIQGVGAATNLLLINNNLVQLSESVFKPILDIQTQGTGKTQLDGNALDCGCGLGWVVTSPAYLSVLPGARCANGTRVNLLDPQYFLDNC